MGKIQVLKPKYRVTECMSEIKECLDVGWTGMGFKTVEFEDKWKQYTGLPNAHFLNSATAGLHLAVKIFRDKYGWEDGDEVITSPFTFVSTNHAITYENLKPCFADIDRSLNLDPDSVVSRINERTRAIIFVGLGGNTANLDAMIEIAREHQLILILDAAHMAGSRIGERHVGYGVDASVFSFQAVKNLPTADSGMVCFQKGEDDLKARELSWLGINKDTFSRSNEGSYKWDYQVHEVGFKYHGNSIMAALGLVGLRYLDDDNKYRRALAARYMENLNDKVDYIKHESDTTSRHIFQVVVENRDYIIDFLSQNNVYPGVHYRQNNEYKPFRSSLILKNSKFFSERVLSLPLHLEISMDDVDRICKLVLEENSRVK
jgi:dTDP-4-amino-4,6-dideoxygalactose transaminase